MRQITLNSSLTNSASSQQGAAADEPSSSLASESSSALAAAAALASAEPPAMAAAAAAPKPSSSLAAPQCAAKQVQASVKTCSMFANYSSSSNCSMGVSTPTKANEDATAAGSAASLVVAAAAAGPTRSSCMLMRTHSAAVAAPGRPCLAAPGRCSSLSMMSQQLPCASPNAALSSTQGTVHPSSAQTQVQPSPGRAAGMTMTQRPFPCCQPESSPLMVANMREVQLARPTPQLLLLQ